MAAATSPDFRGLNLGCGLLGMFFRIELGLAVTAIALAYTRPSLASSWFERAERLFSRLAQRRGLAVVTVGVTALVARAALLPILPIPQPGVHDEFGYLLLADTFAHGRLTNPTHPMWVHFETFHVIWQPTYTTMFYPAQGLIMAVGQVIMGHPFWGVWLSVGLMCAAICWMLQGWMPPGWALLGGLLAVIRLGTFSYWANSYWGGAVAATGGALVLGALPRIWRSGRPRDAVLMGLGFAIVANSRPYEGTFLGLPVAGALAIWLFGKGRPAARLAGASPLIPPPKEDGIKGRLKRVVAPLALVLLLTGCAMGCYFWRTTGSPWNTPYLVTNRTYNPVPYFSWQPRKPPPVYHHPVMQDYYCRIMMAQYDKAQSIAGTLEGRLKALILFWDFYLGVALSFPLVVALLTLPYGFSWRDVSGGTRLLSMVCLLGILGSMLPIYFSPHYAAPITGALFALVLQAMRHVRPQTWRGRPTGAFITRSVPLVCLLMFALQTCASPLRLQYIPGAANLERAKMLAQLRQYPGRQLAIVRYGPQHDTMFREWVYNEADIDRAKVVWARDMGPAENKELIDYFHDRRVWLVEADETPPRLSAYSALADPATSQPNQGAR